MVHWSDIYPHNIYASVLLLDNKIYNYKIGARYWETIFDMTWRFPIHSIDTSKLTVKHEKFEVHNDKEHEEVFNILAREWFRKWEIHKDYKGSKPY